MGYASSMGRGAQARTHLARVNSWSMEDAAETLNQYRSFIWPYFMQQELGAKSVADAWKSTEQANTCQQLMQAVDKQLPFAQHALRSPAPGNRPPTPTMAIRSSDRLKEVSPQCASGGSVRTGRPAGPGGRPR